MTDWKKAYFKLITFALIINNYLPMKGLAVYFLSHRGLDSLDNGIEGSGDEIAKTNTPN